MHSSIAAWVLGLARLISSPTTTLAKIPPGRNSNWRVSWLNTETPVTSEGSRSGVNWIRRTGAVDRARERLAEHRLADAGHVLDQQVTAGEQHHQRGPGDLRLALDDRRDVGLDPLGDGADLVDVGSARRIPPRRSLPHLWPHGAPPARAVSYTK